MSEMTYGRLDKLLRSIGFSVQIVDETARAYKHKETGARLILPIFPDNKSVLPYHLVAVHMTLDLHGIPEPQAFAALVPRAG